jgi:hypothetical protein
MYGKVIVLARHTIHAQKSIHLLHIVNKDHVNVIGAHRLAIISGSQWLVGLKKGHIVLELYDECIERVLSNLIIELHLNSIKMSCQIKNGSALPYGFGPLF